MTEAPKEPTDEAARGQAAARGARATLARCFAASVLLHAGLFGMSSVWTSSVELAAGDGSGTGDGGDDGELFTIRVRGSGERAMDGARASEIAARDAIGESAAADEPSVPPEVATDSAPIDAVASETVDAAVAEVAPPSSERASASSEVAIDAVAPSRAADARVAAVGGAPPSDAETIAELAHRDAEARAGELALASGGLSARRAPSGGSHASAAPAAQTASSAGSTSGGGSGAPARGADAGASSGNGGAPGAGGRAKSALVSSPAPVYPLASRRLGEEGSVTCVLHVAADGRVSRVDVARSSGHARLDRAACDGLSLWRFERDAVPFTFTHTVRFELE